MCYWLKLNELGDGMVVAPSMVGVLGDGMVDKGGARCQILIGGLLGDEGDGIDHPLTLRIYGTEGDKINS